VAIIFSKYITNFSVFTDYGLKKELKTKTCMTVLLQKTIYVMPDTCDKKTILYNLQYYYKLFCQGFYG